MAINLTLPPLSPAVVEGRLARRLVKEGDRISPGDVLAEVETDKATMEIEAVDEGIMERILVPSGTEGVRIHTVIAILAGASDRAIIAPATENAPQDKQTPGRVLADSNPQLSEIAPRELRSQTSQDANLARLFASPLARRLAREGGVDITTINGTGPKGRVLKSDVISAISACSRQQSQPDRGIVEDPADARSLQDADATTLSLCDAGSHESRPHEPFRQTIASRLTHAKNNIPHFYLSIDCELDELLALRNQLNAAAPLIEKEGIPQPSYRISVNDMAIKALALSLRDTPDANVSWTEASMVRHKYVDIGVAVSVPGGIISPIVRRADEKTISVISNEMKDLAVRARARKLAPSEYQGGSTSISNLGMFGIKKFSAIINPPQSSILTVGAIEQRPIVKDGAIAVSKQFSVVLSTDHRAMDGALASEFLGVFKRYVEHPLTLLV